MSRPPLSVIIVNTNKCDLLRMGLQALQAADLPPGTELIVVDNVSVDGSAEMVERDFPGVRVIRQRTRRGPAANYNAGFAAATGDYLVVLNEDAEVTPDALMRLYRYMEAHPKVGMTGPRLIYPDGRAQQSCNRFPRVMTVFKRLFLQAFMSGQWVHDGYPEEVAEQTFNPDWIMATSLMIRRAALEEVGPYDEQFEIYYEETDFAYRLRARGWEITWVADALVKHHHGVSNFKLRGDRDIHFRMLLYQSKYRYFRKNRGPLLTLGIRALEAGFFGAYAVKTGLESLIPSRAEAARLKNRMYADLFRYALRCRPEYAIPQPGE